MPLLACANPPLGMPPLVGFQRALSVGRDPDSSLRVPGLAAHFKQFRIVTCAAGFALYDHDDAHGTFLRRPADRGPARRVGGRLVLLEDGMTIDAGAVSFVFHRDLVPPPGTPVADEAHTWGVEADRFDRLRTYDELG